MLHAFQRKGWQAYGVELSDKMTPFLPDLSIQYGIDAFDLPEKFQKEIRSIGLFDVIEHLPDRVAFLSRCRKAFPNVRVPLHYCTCLYELMDQLRHLLWPLPAL